MKYALLFIATVGCLAQEAEAPARPWTDELDLSIVGTSGNSESTTFGFKNHYTYNFEKAKFELKLGGIRVETTKFTHFAIGTPEAFEVVEEEETLKTDEKYYVQTKYSKSISDRFFWDASLDWDRNEFAGIKNRYAFGVGVGHVWKKTDTRSFSSAYTLLYNTEDLVFETPDFDDSYGSIKLSYEWKENKGAIKFKQEFAAVANLETSEDFRADLKNELSTGLTKRLALKVGLDVAYDHQPAFKGIPLLVDGVEIDTVPYELDELDYLFKTSLVLTF